MIRDVRLRRLSGDHHRALVLARALSRLVERGEAGADAARELADRFSRELEPHFRLEDEVLLPALRAAGELALVARTEEDHRVLREGADAARAGATDGLAAFAERLAEHVRFEERELFPCCERSLPAEVLDEVDRRAASRPSPE